MGKIGIYGGSFNPVHNGHVMAAEEFVRNYELDKLLVIPAGIPPHKEPGNLLVDGSVRANMLRIAMADIPCAEVDETELRREGKSYTIDTVRSVGERFPDDELFLLMGTDMFLTLRTWKDYGELLKLTTVVVFSRHKSSPKEQQALVQLAHKLENEFDAKVEFPANAFCDVSSTLARRMLFFGCAEGYIPAGVLKSIMELKLYGVGDDYTGLSFESLQNAVSRLYDPPRFRHAVGCSQSAAELAEYYGEDKMDAARAGILHDITKALPPREQLRLCENYGIILDDYCGDQVKLLHGKTAAAAAQRIFGENQRVCDAVSWHTTGRMEMTLLEKIIYIADYIEPNRDFDGVEQLRELAYTDLDQAVLNGLQMTIDFVTEKKRTLNRHSVEARDFLARKGK